MAKQEKLEDTAIKDIYTGWFVSDDDIIWAIEGIKIIDETARKFSGKFWISNGFVWGNFDTDLIEAYSITDDGEFLFKDESTGFYTEKIKNRKRIYGPSRDLPWMQH